jgi:hypothetical protein
VLDFSIIGEHDTVAKVPSQDVGVTCAKAAITSLDVPANGSELAVSQISYDVCNLLLNTSYNLARQRNCFTCEFVIGVSETKTNLPCEVALESQSTIATGS